ncbi:hypothetical protein EJB05_31863, partial [Eragrostis curvula]
MPPPWVVIPGDIGCSKSFTLISVPTRQGFRWTPPGGLGLRCVGSNGGWLAGAYIAADRTVRIVLVNPLTGARVEAPPAGRVSFMPDPERHKYKVEDALSVAVQKVAFSPNPTAQDFAVAVVGVSRVSRDSREGPAARFGDDVGWYAPRASREGPAASFGVAFARAGDDGWCAWAELPDQRDRSAGLDVAYRDGKFYYMTVSGELWVVDMAAPSPKPAKLATFPRATLDDGRRGYHLGFSGDGALHVVSSNTDDASRLYVLTQWHDDPSFGLPAEGVPPWTRARQLRGQAFLVGDFNQTLCAPVPDGSACLRPDSVYFFTGVPLCSGLAKYSYSYREREVGRDGVGVRRLDLITGTFQRPVRTRKIRFRPILDFWQPAWSSRYKDDLLEEETWNRLKLGLDWTKAIWFMPSMR